MDHAPFLRRVHYGRIGQSIFLLLQQGTHGAEIVIEIIRRDLCAARSLSGAPFRVLTPTFRSALQDE
jgi:hypothetical protein